MELETKYPEFMPMGDQCVIVRFGTSISEEVNQRVINFAAQVVEFSITGIIEVVPAYAELAVYYNALITDYKAVLAQLKKLSDKTVSIDNGERRVIRVPVCYGDHFGPDLEYVAGCNQKTIQAVINEHTSRIYPVYMLGFTPGFCYLGNLSNEIACPRKKEPRLVIPAGSVGIAGEQTGIYPLEMPGGWQLIGRTPLALFSADREPNVLIRAGDAIQFYAISADEFNCLQNSFENEGIADA